MSTAAPAAAADRIPPSAAFSTPAAGAAVRASFRTEITVRDNVRVRKAELYVAGRLVGVRKTAPWALTAGVAGLSGRTDVQWRVYDPAGNRRVITRSVDVDTTAPTVSVFQAAPDGVLQGTVAVVASVSDNRAVRAVQLLVDDQVVATRTSAPWRFSIDANAYGTFRYAFRAYDRAGNSRTTPALSATGSRGLSPSPSPEVPPASGVPSAPVVSPAPGVPPTSQPPVPDEPAAPNADLATARWILPLKEGSHLTAGFDMTLTMRLTSGRAINDATVEIQGPGEPATLRASTLLSGSDRDGVWMFSGALPRTAPDGQWRITKVSVKDYTGRVTLLEPTDMPYFPVDGAPQPLEADLGSACWIGPTVMDNSVDRPLRLEMHLVSDAGLSYATVDLTVDPVLRTSITLTARQLVSGTPNNGVFEFTGTIPAHTRPGEYSTAKVTIVDNDSQKKQYDPVVLLPGITLFRA